LARMFRSTPGIRTCRGSTVSRASFFDLGNGERGRWLEGVVPSENLRGGLGWQERLLNWFVESCKLQDHHARSP
jgi:hypothetical protein